MSSSGSIKKEDVFDTDFVDAYELASDGYSVYRTSSLVSTTASTKQVVIVNSTIFDRLDQVDASLEVGDRVRVYGNAADGYYTVSNIINPTTFSVIESILDSTGGYCDFIYPAGSTKVGIDNSKLRFTDSKTLQGALEDLDGYLSTPPNGVGQVLFAISPTKFSVAMPVTSNQGWLVNDQGILLVNQVYPDDPD
jgi:hypothetical protein